MATKFKLSKKEERSAWLMILPQVLGFIAFSLLPLLLIISYSVYDYDGVTKTWAGLDNFVRLFTRDPVYWQSLFNTFVFAFGKLIIEIPLALVLAVFVNSNIKGAKAFKGIFFMPNVLSTAIVALIFSFIFASYNGIVNNILLSKGWIETPINFLGEKWNAFGLLIFISVWQNFGVNMLLLLSGLQGISTDVYESSSLDGASPVQQFFQITIPMLMPVLKTVLMLAIIGSMTMTDLVLVLTNGGPVNDTNVAMLYIYQNFFGRGDMTSSQDIGYGAALGVVTAIILWIIVFFYKKLTNKIDQMSD